MSATPEAYVELADGWRVWTLAVLRGAGFPFAGVLELASPGLAAAAGDEPYERALADAFRDAAAAADRIGADPAFREALRWQNPGAYAMVASARPGTGRRNQAARRRQELIARYWQRYCAKNDTIGFFGPVGWARLRAAGGPTRARAGPELVAGREVFLERWCVEALAASLVERHGLRPHVAPLRGPAVRLEGRTLRHPQRAPQTVTPLEAALIARADGVRPAREIAAELGAAPGPGEVYALLERLAERGALTWELPLSPDLRPERALEESLRRLPDPWRAPALAELAELVGARDRVAAAAAVASGASRAEELDRALGEFEATFVRLTGAAPTRRPGQQYAGRTPIYLDARRDLELDLGPELLEAVAEPLALLLASARWLTGEARRTYEAALGEVHEQLAAEAGGAGVELCDLWFWSQGLLFGSGPRPVDGLLREFAARWERILWPEPAARPVTHRAADLEPAVARAFAAAGPGWPSARYHSADLQIAAGSLDEVRAGRFEVVLGELHIAWNPAGTGVFWGQHPDPAELAAYAERDIPEDRVILSLPLDWPRMAMRTMDRLRRPRDLRLAFAPAPREPGVRELALADLVSIRTADGLVARTRDGRTCLPLLDLFADALSMLVVEAFKLLCEAPHRPRTSIDRLVVARESWAFPAADLRFREERDEGRRFLAAGRWVRDAGLPRFAFVRLPVELKPFFVDFESLTLVNVLASALRRVPPDQTAVFTEMLPGPTQLWLPDERDRRYCGELRVVAVDAQRAPSPS